MDQIIAYGDSNPWGLNPVLKNRYPDNVRWTGILRNRLRTIGLTLAEEGLCGRTTVFRDPRREGLVGAESIPQALAVIIVICRAIPAFFSSPWFRAIVNSPTPPLPIK